MRMFFILLVVILLPFVSADEFLSYDLEVTLDPSGIAHEKIENSFILNQNANNILFSTDQDVQNIKTYDEAGILNFALTDSGISIDKQVTANQKNSMTIEFDSKDLVRQSGKEFIFSLNFLIPFESKQTKIKLNLPEGFILSDIDSPLSPKPSSITTNGRRISIIWEGIESNEESFIAIFRRGYAENSESSKFFYLVSVLIIFLIALSIAYIQKRKTREFISNTLNTDENKVLGLIRKETHITQKRISEILGFSKSKMSKLTRRLEEKGLLRRKPFYKTNKFELSKKVK